MVWITDALDATQKSTIRKRRLPGEMVIQLIVANALYRRRSMLGVLQTLDLALPATDGGFVTKSAITQARQRLGEAPMKELFRSSAKAWTTQTASHHNWKGLSLWAIDGTNLRTPDSPVNRGEFGANSYASGTVGSYPQVKVLTLTSVTTRFMLDAAFGRYSKNEMQYIREGMIDNIPNNSLTMFDKGFYSAQILIGLTVEGDNRHFLIPAKKGQRHRIISGAPEDAIIGTPVSPQARQANRDLPVEWVMRRIQMTRSDGTHDYLLTSLLDQGHHTAEEFRQMYRKRWEIETSYSDLKDTLFQGKITLRSGNTDTVRQEIWGTLIAYNLVRMKVAEAAMRVRTSPQSVSFKLAMEYLQDALICSADEQGGLLPRRSNELGQALLIPNNGRECPRVVKARPIRYPIRWIRIGPGSNRTIPVPRRI